MALGAGSRPVFPDSLTSLITFSRNPVARTPRYASRNPVITQHVTNGLTSLSLSGLGDKATITTELKVYLPDELDTRFRKAAMSRYGYGRGSLSRAATEAFSRWCSEQERDARIPGSSSIDTSPPNRATEATTTLNEGAANLQNDEGSAALGHSG